MLIFEKPQKVHIQSIQKFLIPNEYRCIGLVSHLIEHNEITIPTNEKSQIQDFYILVHSEKSILPIVVAVFILLKNGILYHCVDRDFDWQNCPLPCLEWLKKAPIYCIIGSKEPSIYIESFKQKKTKRSVEYFLMVHAQKEPMHTIQKIEEPYNLTKITQKHIKDIYPLQKGYEKEEVMPPGEAFNKKACLALLQKNIENQHIFAIYLNGTAVAKAGTNALGYNWNQLGGVFTAPEHRGKGLAKHLVRHLIDMGKQTNKGTALFVKTTNQAALHAYKTVGFIQKENFSIIYRHL